jgi:hypothetical protein
MASPLVPGTRPQSGLTLGKLERPLRPLARFTQTGNKLKRANLRFARVPIKARQNTFVSGLAANLKRGTLRGNEHPRLELQMSTPSRASTYGPQELTTGIIH